MAEGTLQFEESEIFLGKKAREKTNVLVVWCLRD
jgi:hypothetical protein